MDLMIDQEFADKIPPLTKEEFEQLETNILADGVVINPLIVWNGVIVDGHNRYRILQMHPEIPYQTHEKEFTDRYEAIAWICKNQLGRRNLTPAQRKYLIGKQYEAEKNSEGFRGKASIRQISAAMASDAEHPEHRMPTEFIIEELTDALDSMIFRWDFMLGEHPDEAGDKECRRQIQLLVEKGRAYLKLYRGGKKRDAE